MRNRFLAAITASLKRSVTSWDPGDLSRAEKLFAQAMSSNDLALITAAVSVWQQIVATTPGDHPDRALRLSNLGGALWARFELAGVAADLDESISVVRAAVTATPKDHPDWAMCLSNLGIALRVRFERLGAPADLDEAISVSRAAVAASPINHTNRAGMLSNLGIALGARFELAGVAADLDESISVIRAAIAAALGNHPDRAGYLSNLGGALRIRFERLGALTDLDEAISVSQDSVTATPRNHRNRGLRLSILGGALQRRFERLGRLADLDEAISVSKAAVAATPRDNPNRMGYLSNLGTALQCRFERLGRLADLDEAISVGRAAVAATPGVHPHRGVCLSNLGTALQCRFERVGRLADLDEAIIVGRAAVAATSDNHPNRSMHLSNLGNALLGRFERVGALADLDEAIIVGRAAITANPEDHPDRAAMLSNLGNALQRRFERLGRLADLDEAITASRAAVAATPDNHRNHVNYLSNLGASLARRFERVGALADLDEAISMVRATVAATSHDHPDRAVLLSNLGTALQRRFERVGALADLDEAISMGRDAVAATPGEHPHRGVCLSNLGNALQRRFERLGRLADLDEAIGLSQAAVAAMPPDHPDRAMYLSNLGASLACRFERVGRLADLDEAIGLSQAAVAAMPPDHPDRAMYLSNLGTALQCRFERVGAQADLDEAISTYVQGAEVESGAASVRIRSARVAASLGARSDAKAAAELLEGAVWLLPQTAPRQLRHSDQHFALGQFAGLARDAAALALRADTSGPSGDIPATRALRLLELGRGVLLSQALDTRSDLTDLHTRHPGLAARFLELRDQLDQPGGTSPVDGADPTPGWTGRQIRDRHQLAAAFEATVAEIRRQDGFRTFLLPPERDQLLDHTQHGPIVVVNVSQYRSDALLLTPSGITAVALPDLTPHTLIDQVTSFHQALDTAHAPNANARHWERSQDALNAVLEWLWDAVTQPVLDELDYQHTPRPGTTWPRLWWVPGGQLGGLPLHAAGHHREPPRREGERRTVLDRVISSYTPTIRALGYAREHNHGSAMAQRALIVAMPTTPGTNSPLRYVAQEAELISKRLPMHTLLIENSAVSTAQRPTKASVLAHLGECAIAHFACHGSSHPSDPSQSLLLLHDHDTDPLTVASLAPIRLDHAHLAYLSACRTAFNPATNLADEAIHLTTAFQLAGYPHVVGTLWEIDDELSVRVADTFYTALTTNDNTLDTTLAAQALHHTIRALRDEMPETPSRWAAYLHAGA